MELVQLVAATKSTLYRLCVAKPRFQLDPTCRLMLFFATNSVDCCNCLVFSNSIWQTYPMDTVSVFTYLYFALKDRSTRAEACKALNASISAFKSAMLRCLFRLRWCRWQSRSGVLMMRCMENAWDYISFTSFVACCYCCNLSCQQLTAQKDSAPADGFDRQPIPLHTEERNFILPMT